MEKIRCLIAEDEPLAQDRLMLLLDKYEEHPLVVTACCANGLEVIRTLKEQNSGDYFPRSANACHGWRCPVRVLDKFTGYGYTPIDYH
ncbi:MAG: hypothetical protein R2792_17230 [Saprospiraceae bacterium]